MYSDDNKKDLFGNPVVKREDLSGESVGLKETKPMGLGSGFLKEEPNRPDFENSWQMVIIKRLDVLENDVKEIKRRLRID